MRTTKSARRDEMPYFFAISKCSRAGGVIHFRVNLQNVELHAYVCDPLRAYTASVLQLLKNVCMLRKVHPLA